MPILLVLTTIANNKASDNNLYNFRGIFLGCFISEFQFSEDFVGTKETVLFFNVALYTQSLMQPDITSSVTIIFLLTIFKVSNFYKLVALAITI